MHWKVVSILVCLLLVCNVGLITASRLNHLNFFKATKKKEILSCLLLGWSLRWSVQYIPFCLILESPEAVQQSATSNTAGLSVLPQIKQQLKNEGCYHGKLNRKAAESLLVNDGDFLVRESTTSPGQYVLSGLQGGQAKHLLLVDPQGKVRTFHILKFQLLLRYVSQNAWVHSRKWTALIPSRLI